MKRYNSMTLLLLAILILKKAFYNVFNIILVIVLFAMCWEYVLGVYFTLLWFLGTMFVELLIPIIMLMIPDPPVPEIEYGRFPYEIVYSVEGEELKKADTLEFKYTTRSDYDRVEKSAFWWSSEYSVLLCEIKGQEIYIDGGDGDYYMMNEKPYKEYVPGQYIYYYGDSGKIKLSLEEAKEQLGIEIISAKFSDPIENEFEYRTVDKIRMFLTGGGED